MVRDKTLRLYIYSITSIKLTFVKPKYASGVVSGGNMIKKGRSEKEL